MKELFFIGSLVYLLFSTPALAAAKNGLLGDWICQGEDGTTSLSFRSTDSLIYDGEMNRYRLQGDAIMVQGEWDEEAYRYSLNGNRLKVTFPEGDRINCKRVSTAGWQKEDRNQAQGGNAQLRGRLCQWSGSSSSYSGSSYSRTSSIEFDGQGHVLYSSESSYSGNTGMAHGSSGGTRGQYRVAGNQVTIRLEDGSQVEATVNMKQNDGRITELMANGKLWATGLCQ
ncbi:MAG: hypothetical protein KJ850_00820 [Gammaproteobacteria bacterium]|nr:hypothetical protein [Gammaproteobacteria bacterium]MBU1623564.1 hypothetical protein [Gammaproteobacteria bacterium]